MLPVPKWFKNSWLIMLFCGVLLGMVLLTGCAGPADIVVSSAADSGEGSLRRALQAVEPGGRIVFDAQVFHPEEPVTIHVASELPPIDRGNISVDAGNAGVILDGAGAQGNGINGLVIQSGNNSITGLQIVNFKDGAGIFLGDNAVNNTVGGDRSVGKGPTGQGNLLSGNTAGIILHGSGSTGNVIKGNLVGTNPDGARPPGNAGNDNGIIISEGAGNNVVGEDNIIAFNSAHGVVVEGKDTINNTITRNRIYSNGSMAISLEEGNSGPAAPVITEFDAEAGTVKGSACAGCTVEIFSSNGREGKFFEGEAKVDGNGDFSFSGKKPQAPRFTATVTDTDGNTSEFAVPTETSEIVVSSTADSGEGTLRRALTVARPGDIITFDQEVFAPGSPATIYLSRELPPIDQGYLTIDAGSAGVILDGESIKTAPGVWTHGLSIHSDWNVIQGLQIVNFSPASGIILGEGAQNNKIGGERSVGSGPLGQGNLIDNVDTGIALQGENTSFNVIAGNLVGIDPEGEAARGNYLGIHVLEGASRNIIGPDNVIAYNEMAGLIVEGKQCFGNTITRNSVYGNFQHPDICLWDGANSGIEAPRLLSFERERGKLSGVTVPSAVVEVYSLDDSEGLHYEGKTTANIDGDFSYSKGKPLVGQFPVLLATDPLGNSSALSRAKLIPQVLQAANQEPLKIIPTKTSAELDDNRIGGHWDGLWVQDNLDALLDEIISFGMTSYRFSINSVIVDSIDWSKSEWTIVPEHEAFIDALVENDITLTYVLTFWDIDFVNAGGELGIPRFKCEGEVQRYLDFVQNMVRLLGDRVEYYEIWNEAIAMIDSIEHIEVEDYIALVKRAAPVIREENPEAKIVISGTCYLIMDHNHEFLNTVINSELMELGDVIALHPMYGTSPEDDFQREYYYNYDDIILGYKDKAAAAGFKGRFVADELTWRTPDSVDPGMDWLHAYEEIIACKYNLRGILMNLGLDVAVTQQHYFLSQTIINNGLRNLCTVMEGHEAIDMPVVIDIDYGGPVAYCTFRYPDGDRMLAVWTDDVAVKEDPGVSATITFPGLAAESVTGIDVLHGLEQELLFDIEGESTVVSDFLVKDYPTLIRLSNPKMSSGYEETVGEGFYRLW